jgi:hypothetical protein
MARTQAEQHNDGGMMVHYMRLDMPQFWAYNHYKYMILAHRLLEGKLYLCIVHTRRDFI